MSNKFYIYWMRWLSILSTLLVSAGLFAQADLSGSWTGVSYFGKSAAIMKWQIQHENDSISGWIFNKTLSTGDSSKVLVKGVFENQKLILRPISVEYKTGLSCGANLSGKLFQESNNFLFQGKWKGDLKKTTCFPGIQGTYTIYKDVSSEVNDSSESLSRSALKSVSSEQLDGIGKALRKVLEDREYYAIIIGVDDYNDEDIPDLDNPISDAKRLKSSLVENYTFDNQNITFLENPKREEIIQAFDDLADISTEKDNVLVFYAGHGIWNEQLQQGYWLPANANDDTKGFWLSNSTIRDYLRGIPSKHTLLISDACFSGGILKERAIISGKAALETYRLNSRKAMTSGALKTVPDKSVFIEYLVKNLERNTNVFLSADELFSAFKVAVINNSPNNQIPQYGAISQAGDEGGDFIFLKRN